MRSWKLGVVGLAAVSALTAGVAVSSAGGRSGSVSEGVALAAKARVSVYDNFFDPRSLTAERGEKVAWQWRGDNRHNIVFTKVPKGARKKGAETRREGSWRREFWKLGLYKYVCTVHAGMRGSVLVE